MLSFVRLAQYTPPSVHRELASGSWARVRRHRDAGRAIKTRLDRDWRNEDSATPFVLWLASLRS
jgi:hypothetical protein